MSEVSQSSRRAFGELMQRSGGLQIRRNSQNGLKMEYGKDFIDHRRHRMDHEQAAVINKALLRGDEPADSRGINHLNVFKIEKDAFAKCIWPDEFLEKVLC